MIEARRFKTDAAAMIVHSFSPTKRWFEDFAAFAALFGVAAVSDQLFVIPTEGVHRLYLGWASGKVQLPTSTLVSAP
jgi:hypothetical protein